MSRPGSSDVDVVDYRDMDRTFSCTWCGHQSSFGFQKGGSDSISLCWKCVEDLADIFCDDGLSTSEGGFNDY